MTHVAQAEHTFSPNITTYEHERGGHHGFIFNVASQASVWVNDEQAASLAGYILAKVGAREEAERKAATEKVAEAVAAEVVAAVEVIAEAAAEVAEDEGPLW